MKPLLAVLRGYYRTRLFGRCFQSNTNVGIPLFFICFLLYITPGNYTFKTTFATKEMVSVYAMKLVEIANPIIASKCAGARYNANICGCIHVTGAALVCFVWKVQIYVGWENNSTLFRGKEGRWQDCRDQRSNQSPAVRGESREGGKRGGGGGEFDGESYRKVLLYTAYGTLRCEGGKERLSIFRSHSCRDPTLSIHAI